MGAGENALFEIFSTNFTSPPGTLLVIDEIELGLHESAQRKLINELKKLCKERHIQVICTTHSPAILETIPPEGRFFIESYPGKTMIIPGISLRFAAGKLSGEKNNELDIYVEDGVASHLIEAFLTNDIRKRVSIISIGSPAAIIRQMAGRYKHKRKVECLAIMDGDQSTLIAQHIDHFIKSLELSRDRIEEIEWFEARLRFLPGDIWPEKWMMKNLIDLDLSNLSNLFGTTKEELYSYMAQATSAGKHNGVHNLAKSLSLDMQNTCCTVCRWLAQSLPKEFAHLNETIESLLP